LLVRALVVWGAEICIAGLLGRRFLLLPKPRHVLLSEVPACFVLVVRAAAEDDAID